MASIAKASEHIKPCNIAQCERHNRRDADYIASLNPAWLYIRLDLTHNNECYTQSGMAIHTPRPNPQQRVLYCALHGR